ncbi:MAG: 23S rRNA (pseudouridine(1915)-N(3))-methyltransferase RlmH [Selenomonadaceae bacterium]|nr:23S rRNA (pseudouridine(1915)-N(3))-methyltransferase RlmH [Selenomonadaceae bacterium]MBQ7630859.1 23S rRNA (pseudouridine(1915)-N(3))-methyltransferase RlmH [Selenomonadaceae bacterium]
MKINLIVIGKLKEKFLVDGVAEYVKRIKIFSRIVIKEISECRTVDEEGDKLLAQVPQNSFLIALDVAGEALTSEKFAEKISALNLRGISEITFIIGGAFGLSDSVRQAANFKLSLSAMTFTHQMARLILVEQIYRAFKINRGEPYHY